MTESRPPVIGDMILSEHPEQSLQQATFPLLVTGIRTSTPQDRLLLSDMTFSVRCLGANGKVGRFNLYRNEIHRCDDMHGMSREGQVFLISGWPKPVPDGS